MPEIVALGTFDGVHIGHKKLIKTATDMAAAAGGHAVIYTFSNHPGEVFGRSCKLLMTPEQRIKALGELCDVKTDVFDAEYANLSQRAFAEKLVTDLHVGIAVAGFNYTFGRRGEGDIALLRRLGAEYGFRVLEVAPLYYEDAPVSSTRIREALSNGEIKKANAMLGYEYSLTGNIVPARHIGTGLGFPTANIEVPQFMALPENGVYVTTACAGGKEYGAVTNIGSNPTVNGTGTHIETNLMDFSGSIYGEMLTIRFIERIRAEQRFENTALLAAQIAKDKVFARNILNQRTPSVYKPQSV